MVKKNYTQALGHHSKQEKVFSQTGMFFLFNSPTHLDHYVLDQFKSKV